MIVFEVWIVFMVVSVVGSIVVLLLSAADGDLDEPQARYAARMIFLAPLWPLIALWVLKIAVAWLWDLATSDG